MTEPAHQLAMSFEPRYDRDRLGHLLGCVLDALRTGAWLTLFEIRERTGCGSEAGISARIRELRGMGFTIDRRRRPTVDASRGLFEYRLSEGRFRTV